MLVLSRRVEEELWIGGVIRVRVLSIRAGVVRIGIDAPREVSVVRDDVINDQPRRSDDASGDTI